MMLRSSDRPKATRARGKYARTTMTDDHDDYGEEGLPSPGSDGSSAVQPAALTHITEPQPATMSPKVDVNALDRLFDAAATAPAQPADPPRQLLD